MSAWLGFVGDDDYAFLVRMSHVVIRARGDMGLLMMNRRCSASWRKTGGTWLGFCVCVGCDPQAQKVWCMPTLSIGRLASPFVAALLRSRIKGEVTRC